MTQQEITSINRQILDDAFTFMNLELVDDFGQAFWTQPDRPRQRQHPLFLASCRVIENHFARTSELTLLDVGCFEGGYTLEFARRLGCHSVGIEPRPRNFAACKIVQRFHGCDAKVEFQQVAAQDYTADRPFDVIFAAGALHQMEYPATWLKEFAAPNCNMLILNTHFAKADTLGRFAVERFSKAQLGDICSHDGYKGRWYRKYEHEEARTAKQVAATKSSWGNVKSFFLLKGELIQSLLDVGFHTVFELFDACGRRAGKRMQTQEYSDLCRSTFVGIK